MMGDGIAPVGQPCHDVTSLGIPVGYKKTAGLAV